MLGVLLSHCSPFQQTSLFFTVPERKVNPLSDRNFGYYAFRNTCHGKIAPIITLYGIRGAVRGVEGIHPVCITNKTQVMPLVLPSPLHACPRHGTWATFIRLSHARAKSEILKLKIWNSQLRETT
jgi:hypothetical protein